MIVLSFDVKFQYNAHKRYFYTLYFAVFCIPLEHEEGGTKGRREGRRKGERVRGKRERERERERGAVYKYVYRKRQGGLRTRR